MTLLTIGPRHITGILGSSRTRLIDMTLIPVFVLTGTIPPFGPLQGFPAAPSTLAMLGPVRSASSTPPSYPRRFSSEASTLVTKDLPTPPFPEIIAIILRTPRLPRRSIPGLTIELVFGLEDGPA